RPRQPRPAGRAPGAGGRAERADRPAGQPHRGAAHAAADAGHAVPQRRGDVAAMKLPLVILSLVGVGTVAGLLIAGLGHGTVAAEGTPPEDIYTVKRGSFSITLRENGTLVAKESQKISTGSDSGSKLTFLVEEGKTVEQDEVLARLDTKDLETD